MDLLNRYGSSVNGALIHANRLAFGRTEGYLCMTLKSWQPACRQSCLETPCVARRQNIKHNTYPTMMKKLKYSPSSSDGSRSVSYQSRINPVLFPYRPSFFLLSSFFRCSIILASRSGNNTETMRDWYGNNRRNKGGGRKKGGSGQAIQTGSTHPFSDGGVALCALRSYLPIGLISTESIFSHRKVCSTQQRNWES